MATFLSTLMIPQLFLFALLNFPTTIFAETVGPATKPLGFSLNLIHRDSPLSPLYDPSSTPAERVRAAALRSKLRSRRLASSFASPNSTMSSPVKPDESSGEYLMQLNIGTPPNQSWAILDTGSDLVWTLCQPCVSCLGQTSSMFDPRGSSTYKSHSCSTNTCKELAAMKTSFCNGNQLCGFRYAYGDGSEVEGIVASETLWFDGGAGGAIMIPAITFGCVNLERDPDAALLRNPGLVGLGYGPFSLVSQLGYHIDSKFAYCLPKDLRTGQLKFGEDAEFSGTEEIQQTPMAPGDTYYVLTLTDISVGNNRLNIQFGDAQTTAFKLGDARSIIIDSGTPLTHLAKDVYDQVKNAVANVMNYEPSNSEDNLCFVVQNSDPYGGLPRMTFHFVGADWKVPPENAFMVHEKGRICLAIHAVGEGGGIPIFGNIAQRNMHVKYDLGKRLLSFAPAECTKA